MQKRDSVHLPPGAQVGLQPTIDNDIAPSAFFLVLYLLGAIINELRFQLNRRKGHKFLMSWAMFGFAMTRVVTLTLRITYAIYPNNIHLGVASVIFTHAGLLVVYIVLFILSMRILRALQPPIGWSRELRTTLLPACIVLTIAIFTTITLVIIDFYSTNKTYLSISSWTTRACATYILAFNALGIVLFLLATLLPPHPQAEDFGAGSMAAKLVILALALFLINFIAAFRTAVAWVDAPPVHEPAWFDSRGVFYGWELAPEILVIYLFVFTRFERRFWVPDGSWRAGITLRGVRLWKAMVL
ncbi:hypothetical protein M409DRAFT_21960 [Zasmidium cellare ATCC 36951]|uniref:G-protein coupled receptors family 3 profile domain-containing protein n=1 Tax=Zasmidium cellare ATCC 36951 TaxID=1080233 RepID=A0A6A6CPM6_ZASCE|nr:uncharacterized protein M409DRAFT_21960 [Zasmidium cellare ATCC 36951]KAF2167812.1 hypothetical protein M409DRAFT_21960 [Zasmidium cellare ATCC 36951]